MFQCSIIVRTKRNCVFFGNMVTVGNSNVLYISFFLLNINSFFLHNTFKLWFPFLQFLSDPSNLPNFLFFILFLSFKNKLIIKKTRYTHTEETPQNHIVKRLTRQKKMPKQGQMNHKSRNKY